jgi:hypothetical protein
MATAASPSWATAPARARALEAPTCLAGGRDRVTGRRRRFAKPIDLELTSRLAAEHDLLVTVEEGSLPGGFGAGVWEALSDAGLPVPRILRSRPSRPLRHARQARLLHREVGFTGSAIAKKVAAASARTRRGARGGLGPGRASPAGVHPQVAAVLAAWVRARSAPRRTSRACGRATATPRGALAACPSPWPRCGHPARRDGPARVYRPLEPAPGEPGCALWLHGGGWIMGDLDGFDHVCRRWPTRADTRWSAWTTARARAPLPAGLDDARTALAWACGPRAGSSATTRPRRDRRRLGGREPRHGGRP